MRVGCLRPYLTKSTTGTQNHATKIANGVDIIAMYENLYTVRKLLYKTSIQQLWETEEYEYVDAQVRAFVNDSALLKKKKIEQIEAELAKLDTKNSKEILLRREKLEDDLEDMILSEPEDWSFNTKDFVQLVDLDTFQK